MPVPFEITLTTYLLALLGTFCLGIAKTGLPGLAIINILIMAHLFQKQSVGIILPLLVMSDLIIFPFYRRFATWRDIKPIFFPALVGILLGYIVLTRSDDEAATRIIGGIILVLLALQWLRTTLHPERTRFLQSPQLQGSVGILIGIATTVANAAGPAYSVWALLRQKSKQEFLGIAARFFLLINILKLPLNLRAGILTTESLWLDALLVPGLLVGIVTGKAIVLRIPQKTFDWILFGLCLVGALWLIVA